MKSYQIVSTKKEMFPRTYSEYRTRAIITCGLYTIFPLFEVKKHIFLKFWLMYGYYSRVVSNQERVIVARVWYIYDFVIACPLSIDLLNNVASYQLFSTLYMQRL